MVIMIVDQIGYADRKAMLTTALTVATSTPIERAQTLPVNTATPAAMITHAAEQVHPSPDRVVSSDDKTRLRRRGSTRR